MTYGPRRVPGASVTEPPRSCGLFLLLAGPHFFSIAPGPHPRRGCSAPSRFATAQGCHSLALRRSKTRYPRAGRGRYPCRRHRRRIGSRRARGEFGARLAWTRWQDYSPRSSRALCGLKISPQSVLASREPELVITRHGRPAAVLVGVEGEGLVLWS